MDSIDFEDLAENMRGYTCADIKQICDLAADRPLKEAMKSGVTRNITLDDFVEAKKEVPCPSVSLRKWLNKVRKSSKAHDFPELIELVKEYGCDDSPDTGGEDYEDG